MTPWYQRIGYATDDGGTLPVHLCRGCGEPYTGIPPVACPCCGLANVGAAPADTKAAEPFWPHPDEAGREALDAPQREFEPGGTPR